MKWLVVGSGGREHALCWSLRASPLVTDLLCAPGNAGIAREARCIAVAADDIDGLVALARRERVDLVVVGPELPLVMGLCDRLAEAGIAAFGPSAAAARLEGSKAFTKAFCQRHDIPTAGFATFDAADRDEAVAYARHLGAPVVVKADGLASGKGVVVAATIDDAVAAIDAAFDGAFGRAGHTVIVEEFLEGEEASLFALCDGLNALEIGTAQDHKRAFDGDRGPNTGGMGAYSPAPVLDAPMIERVMSEMIRPTLAGMAAEGHPFRGFLYAGLMLTAAGPVLIEYNVRFGDPEAQVVLPRLLTDLGQLVQGATDGVLDRMNVRWRPEHALAVVMATHGYPGPVTSGSIIGGLEALDDEADIIAFHAATRREGEKLAAAGGRVLAITGTGATLQQAHDLAYAGVARIAWPDGFYRRDIGRRALAADLNSNTI